MMNKTKQSRNIFQILAVLVLAVFGFIFSANQSLAACPSTGTANCGVFTSQVKDIGYKLVFTTLSWSETKPAGTYVTALEVQAGNPTTAGTACSAGVTWDISWVSVANGGSLAAFSGRQCIQYRTTLSSDDVNYAPSLDEVVINYYVPTGELISSPYNTRNYGNQLTGISWQETKPGTSDVLLQVRTSWEGSVWSSWMGPGGTNGSYFTDPAGGESIPAALSAGNNDQWIQYKLTLRRDYNDATTPALTDLTMSYNLVQYSGIFTSQVKDATRSVAWTTIDWAETLGAPSANALISMRVRLGDPTGADCTSGVTWVVDWVAVANGESLAAINGHRCMQYEATLSTYDSSVVPTLDQVDVGYSYYEDNKTLISSPYNTTSSGNVISQISWKQDANLPTNTELKFQLRSNNIDDAGFWSGGTGWVGPGSGTDCNVSYFTYTPGGANANNGCGCTDGGLQDGDTTRLVNCAIPAGHILKIGDNDQYMQYKVFFMTSDGSNTPALYDTTITYVANSAPCAGNSMTGPPVSCSEDAITGIAQAVGAKTINLPLFHISDEEEAAEGGVVNTQFFYDLGITTPGAVISGNITISSGASLVFPASGYVMIDSEVIQYTSITDGGGVNNDILIVPTSPTGRGVWSEAGYTTQASAHSADATVWLWSANATGKGDKSGITNAPDEDFSAGFVPVSDFIATADGVFYYGSTKIRIALNDGNGSVQIGTNVSNPFILDLKKPIHTDSPYLTINSLNIGAELTIKPITEPSTLYVRYINSSVSSPSISSCNIDFASAGTSWQEVDAAFWPDRNSNITKAHTLNPDGVGVSSVCFQAKDAYENISDPVFASTPATPAGVTSGDVSYGGLEKYRNLVWWTLSGGATTYKIKRCEATDPASTYCSTDTGANYTDFAEIVSGSQNYCFDKTNPFVSVINAASCLDDSIIPAGPTGLTTGSKYCYRVMAEKADGISAYSAITANTCSQPTGDLTGKTPEVPQPAIETGPFHNGSATNGATLATYTSATITWTTDIDSYSLVKYSTDSNLATGVSTTGSTVNQSAASHSVEITNLEPGTQYYYQAISGITPGPSSIDTSAIKNFITRVPTINSVPETTVTRGKTFANFSWTTDAPATSRVYYLPDPLGTVVEADLLATTPISSTEKTTTHNILVNPTPVLDPATQYAYLIESLYGPANEYSLKTAVYTFTTLPVSADSDAPVISAVACDGNLAPAACTPAGSAAITWTTTDATDGNANSYSIVEYNEGSSVTANSISVGSLTVPVTPESPFSHSVTLTGLVAGVQYAYKVHSGDAFGNLATSPTYTFGTNTAPVISGLAVSSYDRTSAVITWTTDKPSYSRLEYSTDSSNSANVNTLTALLSPHADSPTAETSEKVTIHTVVLTNLDQATDHYFRAVSNDGVTTPTKSIVSSFKTTGGVAPTITYSALTRDETTAQITFKSTADAFLSVMYTTDAVTAASLDSDYANASSLMGSADTDATITLSGLTPGTTYNYRLTSRDIYGNTGREDLIRTFTTLADTVDPTVSSGPAIFFTSTSASISWTASEQIYSKVEYSSTTDPDCAAATYSSATALTANYNKDQTAALTSLTSSAKYCYRLYMIDSASRPATNDNSGAGYTFTTAPEIPIIASVTLVGKTATTANITWTTTNVKSSSLVDFGTDLRYGTTQGSSSNLVNNHDVTLIGLTPGTLYKYRVKSVDAFGNTVIDDNSGQGYTFTTNSLSSSGNPPGIGSISHGSVTATSAVIRWTTNEPGDSLVGYGLSASASSYKSETGSSDMATNHAVALTGLSPSTTYYYRVTSRTATNQSETQANLPTGYSFTTLAGTEKIPPVLSGIGAVAVSANTATITWTTDEPATSFVDYSLEGSLTPYNLSQGTDNLSSGNSHSVQLKGLTANTYIFRVRSADDSGNSATLNGSSPFTITMSSDTICEVTPCRSCQTQETLSCPVVDLTAPSITNIKVSDIAFNTATISWTTDENSNSMIGYDIYSYDIKGKFTYSSGNSKDATQSHSITLNNLDSASTYYFRVLSTDTKGNTAESTDQSFKTPAISESKDKGAATSASLKKEFEEIAKTLVKDNLATEENIKDILSRITNPPIIGSEGPLVKDIKSYGATIYWQTDRKANSIVKFTASESSASLSKLVGWKEIGMTNIYGTSHEVTLLGLAPSTAYSFQAQSQDILGNTSSSEIKSFTTAGASSIFNVSVSDLNLTSATITWETANISTSSLEYGPTSSYGNYQDNKDEKVRNHAVTLTNLAPDSTFHFRVRSTEDLGTILVSDDYSFSTPSLPQITKYTLGEVKDNSIALSWTSNIPINTNVRYTNAETNEVKNIGKEEKTTDHSTLIASLEAGKTYKIEIQGRDDANNLATVPAFDVQTGMDVVPPEISQVRSQSAVLSTADDKVQSIISWKTNELSSTKVLWDLGGTKGDTLTNETTLDANLTTNHIVVLTQFKPGTVYRFRVASTDKFGNTAISSDYTVLSPVKRQSIIQMIINQFENIFGWARGLGI